MERARPRSVPLGTCIVLVIVLGWIAPAFAQDQSLIIAAPPGFKVAFTHASPDGAHKIMELVPEGQTVDDWRQMITLQHLLRLGHLDPIQFGGAWAQRFTAACPRVQASRLPQTPVNGHAAVRLYLHNPDCGARPAESVLAVVIRGRDALHMVQHAWRPAPPTRRELDEALASFDKIALCDVGSPGCLK